MITRVPWDKYETALLIEAYIRCENKEAPRLNIIRETSALLRKRALQNGMKIDDTFRNENGIKMRMDNLRYIFTKGEKGLSGSSKLFEEMVHMYQTHRNDFDVILKSACNEKQGKTMKTVDFNKQINYSGAKPVCATYFGTQLDGIDSWSNVYVQIIGILAEDYPDVIEEISEEHISGVGSAIVTKESHKGQFVRPRDIGEDFVVETNRSANDIVRNLSYLFERCNMDSENVEIFYEEKATFQQKDQVPSPRFEVDKLITIIQRHDVKGASASEICRELLLPENESRKLHQYLIETNWAILMPNNVFVHRDSLFDIDESAEIMLTILKEQFKRFNGYTSSAVYYTAVKNELPMFLNDNALDTQEKVFAVAMHLFSIERYNGVEYYFYGDRHIFQEKPDVAISDSGVLQRFLTTSERPVSKEECASYLYNLKIPSGNINGLLNIAKSKQILFYSAGTYTSFKYLNLSSDDIKRISKMISVVLDDIPFVIIRELNESWYKRLPDLPNGLPWTQLLLQELIEKHISEYKTIQALEGQGLDTIKAAIVPSNSKIESFPDVVHAFLVTREKVQFPKRIQASELREKLLDAGMIAGNEIIYAMEKALKDRRFAWSDDGNSVLILQ